MKTLKFGISPCPNDTFIFENIILGKIDIPDVNIEWEFHDIQVLNEKASQGYFDLVKISFAHLDNLVDNYRLLKCGGAMGYGVGPILVKRKGHLVDFENAQSAIPGLNTTANFLLGHFYPTLTRKDVVVFSDIEDHVLNGDYDLGLLIHEGRFTYADKGLDLVADLGELWQKHEQLPIPLGCIVAKNDISLDTIHNIEDAVSRSICNYHHDGTPVISDFIRSHAQEMELDVIRQHIELYVNDFSVDMSDKGLAAIERMREIKSNQKVH